jgi:predicted dehydrogenase
VNQSSLDSVINYGIIATGGIAHRFAESLVVTPGAALAAVASRTQATADAFGNAWGATRRYSSYAHLFDDPSVDVVYVATPHHLHHQLTLDALHAGKHVLVEKPITLNAAQAEAIFRLARSKKLAVVEAVWMRFIPAIVALRTMIADGVIGDIKLITADFCFNLPYDPTHRLYDPAVGGGALLDLGIYPLSFATMFLGMPDTAQSMTSLTALGVDHTDVFQLGWNSGARAQLSCSLQLNREMQARISGSQGWIHVPTLFLAPDRFTVHLDGAEPQEHLIPHLSNGYVHEIEAMNTAIRSGAFETPQQTTNETLQLMRLMDRFRTEWGVQYPGE